MTALDATLKPIRFLLGRWRSLEAVVRYPNMQPISYEEELRFECVGQPILNYTSTTWRKETKSPMHLEAGYLRIKPGTNMCALVSAQNFGYATIEEGLATDECLELKTQHVNGMSFVRGPQVVEVVRCYKMCGFNLVFVLEMATTKQPLTQHCRVTYEKIR